MFILFFLSLFVLILFSYSLCSLYATVSAAPYVPVSHEVARAMVRAAELKPTDTLMDLVEESHGWADYKQHYFRESLRNITFDWAISGDFWNVY